MSTLDIPKTPSLRLDGKRALVTGGGRGLGLAAGAALAQAGAHVCLCARTGAQIEQASDAITRQGGSAEWLQLDITDLPALNTALSARPAFDILVNNAGTNRPKPFTEASPGDYETIMGLNVRAAYFVAQSVAQRMIAENLTGSLIHVSSQMGQVGGANRSLYCASKWALEGMNKAIAIDLAKHGIRSNTIAPTFIETPMTRPFFDDRSFLESVLDKIKLGRLGQLEDVMGAIVFLASDAASLMTGSTITIDGGWTAE